MITPPDRNELARQCADLRDRLLTLGEAFAASQERSSGLLAAMELDAGKSVDEVSERAYDDKDIVLDNVKERAWMGGYIEGLRVGELALNELRYKAIKDAAP